MLGRDYNPIAKQTIKYSAVISYFIRQRFTFKFLIIQFRGKGGFSSI